MWRLEAIRANCTTADSLIPKLHAVLAAGEARGGPALRGPASSREHPSGLSSPECVLASGMRVKSLTQPCGTVPPFPCKHHLHMAMATDASAVTARFDVLTAALPADIPVQRAAFSSLQQTSRRLASSFFQAVPSTNFLPQMLCIAHACRILSFIFFVRITLLMY